MFISAGDEGISINDRPATAIDPIGLHMLAGGGQVGSRGSHLPFPPFTIVWWLLITTLAS